MASKWRDLTDAQKKRLVAVSWGEPSFDDPIWYELRNFELVEAVGTDEGRYIDYLTPAGGALLAERDAILIKTLEWYAKQDNGYVACEALAAVAKERES